MASIAVQINYVARTEAVEMELEDQCSRGQPEGMGVPQGSVPGTTLLVYCLH